MIIWSYVLDWDRIRIIFKFSNEKTEVDCHISLDVESQVLLCDRKRRTADGVTNSKPGHVRKEGVDQSGHGGGRRYLWVLSNTPIPSLASDLTTGIPPATGLTRCTPLPPAAGLTTGTPPPDYRPD